MSMADTIVQRTESEIPSKKKKKKKKKKKEEKKNLRRQYKPSCTPFPDVKMTGYSAQIKIVLYYLFHKKKTKKKSG